VLAVAAILNRGAPSPPIAAGIARACAWEASHYPVDEGVCVALVTTFAAHESGFQMAPSPVSWDAKAGRSVSLLQLRSDLATGDPARDAHQWLRLLHTGTLAGISGGGRAGARVAKARTQEALAALARVTIATPPAD
jgi:hypothetical protein